MDNDKQQDEPLEKADIKSVDSNDSESPRADFFVADTPEPFSESPGESIGNSIDELESLIAETNLQADLTPKLQAKRPVLTDIVEAAEARKYALAETLKESSNIPADKNEDLPIVSLSKLVESVDKKLSSDLDDLVDKLKDTIKDSIMVELKEQLQKNSAKTQSHTTAIDSPDKPSE
jgi:hypothetical protein